MISNNKKFNSTYSKCEDNMSDREVLKLNFGTDNIDVINERFLMGIDFLEVDKRRYLITADRDGSEGLKS